MTAHADLVAENRALRAENHALRVAMAAIRGLTSIPSVELAPSDPAPAAPETQQVAMGSGFEVPNFYDLLQQPDFWPYAPRSGGRAPYWSPKPSQQPEVLDIVHYAAYAWKRPHEGATVTLDRSGAGVTSAASVLVAHDELTFHEGVIGTDAPGFYKVAYAPWDETGTPHPFGGAARQAERDGYAWLSRDRAQLIRDLAVQHRWPQLEPMDAYLGARPARMDRWAKQVNASRCYALDNFGRGSAEYDAVKDAFSIAVSRLIGQRNPGQGRSWDGPVRRADWAIANRDHQAVMMWRWVDGLGRLAVEHGRPQWAPVAIQFQDEMVIPADAFELFTTVAKPGSKSPLVIDESGKRLGSWKVKSA